MSTAPPMTPSMGIVAAAVIARTLPAVLREKLRKMPVVSALFLCHGS
jgi:hypothetical protein